MHNLDTLVSDIKALLKVTGDSGDSGDRQAKPLIRNDFPVTTHAHQVSPLINRVATVENLSGDRKDDAKQIFTEGVATVASVATCFRQGRAPSLAPDRVSEWHAISDELIALNPPDWASPARWQNIVFDASAFLARWASAADQLGWTTLDLFGVHPAAPADRYDVMGLLLIIQGGEVVALTSDAATIRRPSKSILTFRRCDTSGAVSVLEVSR